MGRLKTLTLCLALGAWGAATDGAPPDDAAAPPSAPAPRPDPPAPPGEYVKAAVKLYQSGQHDLAAKYLKAAHDYRDQLSAADQATLDQYRGLMAQAPPADAAVAPATPPVASPRDQAVALVSQARQAMSDGQGDEARRLARQAEGLNAPFAADEDSPARVLADLDSARVGPLGGRGGPSADGKQQARWLLQQAREHIRFGRFDQAQAALDQARAKNVRWGLFDDSPNRVADALEKARAQAPAAGPADRPAPVGDRQTAQAKLKEAREALKANQIERAEAIAQEVAAWNLSYGLRDDTPRKVAAAARALRRRDAVRQAGAKGQPSQEAYDVLVQEARQSIAAGKLDQAEAKARQAHALGVSPPLAADRAESVIHDVAMLRARGVTPPGASDPSVAMAGASHTGPEAPGAAAERAANELLAQGKVEEAKAKFAEAARLQSGLPAPSPTPAAPSLAAPPALAETAPAPVADPALQPVAEPPVAEPPAAPGTASSSLALEQPDTPAPAPAGTPGEAALEQAKALLAAGNYAAARQAASQARDGNSGLDAQANDLLGQIALAEQAGALSLYDAALDAVRKGDVARARALLTEMTAAELDESTAQKVADLMARLPKDDAGKAVVGATETDAEAVAAQKLNAEVGTKVAEARRLMETDPDAAIKMLQATLESVKSANLSAPVAKTMTRRVEVAIELAKKDKTAFETKMKDKAFKAEIEHKRLRILEADKAKKEQMAKLMEKAQEAMSNGQYAEAEKHYKLAHEIDPNEIAAIAGATLARTKRHYETARGLNEAKNESNLIAWEEAEAAGVVPEDVQKRGIGFAGGEKDWAALTQSRRDLAKRLAPQRDPKVVAMASKLEETVTLNFDKQPLGDVLDYLRNYTGLNIVLDPSALAEEGLTESSPVSLKLNQPVKLKNALKLLLGPLHLTYRLDNEVVLLTSPSTSRGQTITQAYGVADLVIPVRGPNKGTQVAPDGTLVTDPNAQATGLDPLNPEGGERKPADAANRTGGNQHVTPEMFTPLIQLIKASVAPGTWKNDDGYAAATDTAYGMGAGLGGGGELGVEGDTTAVGSITPFFLNISLIIRHTAEVHDDVVDLLRQLRRLQDLQVSIEVRFITVSDSFFEQIGVDFDFSIQSDVVSRKSSFAIPNPAAGFIDPATGGGAGGGGGQQGTSPFLINPQRDHSLGDKVVTVGRGGVGGIGNFTPDLQIPFNQNYADAITPFNNILPNPAASFGIAFLSDLEVYLFLQAIQGDTRSNLVQAPKVTTFNGAPAIVTNTTNRNFVASLQPIVANGAVAFTPQVQQLLDGVVLNVTPVVSADRRYVRMTLDPVFQTFIQFDTFTVPAAVSGFLGGSGTINGQIQQPVVSRTEVQTTVTVPDGGTVLLGGVKRLREERREFGVPILAKTPMINRLFRNIGIGRTTDSLMLMVTPRIIILEEEEERLGVPAVPTFAF